MVNYIESGNDYADFVMSECWDNHLTQIREISPKVADAINEYGIGTKICDDGDYDFESGQLLEDLPKSFKSEYEEEIEMCYDLICDLAKSYAKFVNQ